MFRTVCYINSASVPKDDAIAILNLKSPLQIPAATLSLSYKDLKGDQPSKVIQDLDGNDLESFRNIKVEIISDNNFSDLS